MDCRGIELVQATNNSRHQRILLRMRNERPVRPQFPNPLHFCDFLRIKRQRDKVDVAPHDEDVVKLVVDVGSAIQNAGLAQRGHEPQLVGAQSESQLLMHLPDRRVDRRFACGEMPGGRHVPQRGIVLLSRRTALQQDPPVGGHDPHVRRAMPVAAQMDLRFRLAYARWIAFRSEDVDEFGLSPRHDLPCSKTSARPLPALWSLLLLRPFAHGSYKTTARCRSSLGWSWPAEDLFSARSRGSPADRPV